MVPDKGTAISKVLVLFVDEKLRFNCFWIEVGEINNGNGPQGGYEWI